MSTPSADSASGRAARFALGVKRARYWARDYLYVGRRQARGLFVREVPATFPEGSAPPVVLLAGVLEPWTLLLPVAERLNRAGHPVHVVPELAYNLATLSEASELALSAVVAKDLTDVILVAHSKGGLVGKRMLADDRDGRLRALIAIATPFQGSSLARLVPSRTIRALSPDDPAIQDLAQRADLNSLVTSISPSFDPHIPDGSHLPGAVNVQVEAIGHFRILNDPDVLDAVVAAARRPPEPRR